MSVVYAEDETLYDYHTMRESIRYVKEPSDLAVPPNPSRPELFIFTRPFRPLDNTRDFEQLAAAWENDTQYVSSSTQIVLHPAYQRIIGMGPSALPLIFARFQRQPQHWFWALRSISGEDPVAPENIGNVRGMTADWFAWGRERGLIQ